MRNYREGFRLLLPGEIFDHIDRTIDRSVLTGEECGNMGDAYVTVQPGYRLEGCVVRGGMTLRILNLLIIFYSLSRLPRAHKTFARLSYCRLKENLSG